MKKYNLSNIMRNAWAIRRKTGCTMSEALCQSWATAKVPAKTVETLTVEDLTAMGGKLWEKGKLRRVYFNRSELMQLCNVKVSYHRTGTISNFSIGGEETSNRFGGEIMSVISGGVYYDLLNHEFASRNCGYGFKTLVEHLTRAVLAA